MNKKVLSAILFGALMAGTGTFTSCIDNDEPAGIEELRGAKAELIRAKVAVEQANASYKLAEAEVQKAEAAIKNAQAELKKALAEEQELKNELLAAQNEQAKAEIEANIAAAQQRAEAAALEHETKMIQLKKALALADRNYELALAQIEIAKATGSEKAKVTIFELETAVKTAQSKVKTAQANVETKEDAHYNATLDVKKGEVTLARYEYAVAKAEAYVETTQAELEKYKNFAEADETVDWREEITAIEDSVKAWEREQVEINVQLAKLQNSEEYKALIDAERDTKEAFDNLKVGKAYSFEYVEYGGNVTRTLYQNGENIVVAYNADGAVLGPKASMVKALNFVGGANWNGKTSGLIYNHNKNIGWYTTERKALLDSIAKHATEGAAKAKENAEKDVKAWENALAAYKAAKNINTDAITKAETGALAKYEKAMEDAEGTEDELIAKQTFADAIVAYYKTLPAAQVGFASITLASTVDGETVYASKTAKEWLSDASMKHKNLIKLEEYFGDFSGLWAINTLDFDGNGTIDGEQKNANGSLKDGGKVTGAFTSFKQKEAAKFEDNFNGGTADKYYTDGTSKTLLGDLVKASYKAFGDAQIYTEGELGAEQGDYYMHTKPTVEDIKRLVFVENVAQSTAKIGTWGMYLLSTDSEIVWQAKNYEAIIKNGQEAVAYWTEKLNEMIAAYYASYGEYYNAYVARKTYEEENFDALMIERDYEIQGKIEAYTRIKNALIGAVEVYLGTDVYTENTGFDEWLAKKLDNAQQAAFKAEELLINAQNTLTKAQDGKIGVWDQLTAAEEALAEAMAELEAAQAELETALANLAKGLEILAETNAK